MIEGWGAASSLFIWNRLALDSCRGLNLCMLRHLWQDLVGMNLCMLRHLWQDGRHA